MVSWAATQYVLGLGARDATTGWPKPYWTANTITIHIEPRGTGRLSLVCGVHNRHDALGFLNFVVKSDDVILQNDVHWKVVGAPLSWTVGDSKKYKVIQLSKLLTFPVPMTEPIPPGDSSHFVGFEQIIPGVQEFEPGFERAYI